MKLRTVLIFNYKIFINFRVFNQFREKLKINLKTFKSLIRAMLQIESYGRYVTIKQKYRTWFFNWLPIFGPLFINHHQPFGETCLKKLSPPHQIDVSQCSLVRLTILYALFDVENSIYEFSRYVMFRNRVKFLLVNQKYGSYNQRCFFNSRALSSHCLIFD